MAKQSLHKAATGAAPPAEEAAVAEAPKGFTMPATFMAPPNKIQSRAWAPYIAFAHPKRPDEWNKLTGKFGNIEEGDMYFIHGDRVEKLDVAKLGLMAATQYWVSKNPAGKILAVSFDERGDPFKEHIMAACVLYLEDAIFPCNIEFRTTKTPMGRALNDALTEASDASWGDKSPAHRETLVLNQPFLRFYGECSIGEARPSKSSGLPYKPGQCTIKPTGLSEMRLIKQWYEDLEAGGEAPVLLDMVEKRYLSKLDELKQYAK